MNIDIEKLPEWAKLEVSKEDLLAFAEKLKGGAGLLPESVPDEKEGLDIQLLP